MRSWLLICLSACLYASSFIAIDYLWWLSLLCFVPLFYAACSKTLSFKEGFIWGYIALGINLSGVFYSIFYLADNPSWQIGLLLCLALCYLALQTGLWFWISHLLVQALSTHNYQTLGIWLLSTWAYTLYIDYYCLWPFNAPEGLVLLNPLVPLIKIPSLLIPLSYLGMPIFVFLFLFFQACIAGCIYFYTHKTQKAVTLSTALLILIIISMFGLSMSILNWHAKARTAIPAWLDNVAILPEAFYNPTNIQHTINQVTQALKKLLKDKPQATVILMPESALFLCDLSAHEQLLGAWNKESLGKSITIITGGITYQQGNSYNTAYLISNGTIQDFFKKRHSMVLTENIASWLNFNFVQSCFYTQRPPITPSTQSRTLFKINAELAFVPYICSELFFNNHPDDNFNNAPIIALCNDTWVIPKYIKKLMYHTAHFRSLQWNRPIIYVAYDYAYYFDKTIHKAL